MGLLDNVKSVLAQYGSGTASAGNAEADFHQVAQSADAGTLTQGIAAIMHSDQTPPFAQIVSQLFSNGSSDQKTAMLNTLLSAVSPDQRNQLASVLGGGATPGGAATATPSADTVASIARSVEQSNPRVVDTMSAFYAQHPALVKTLGSAALMIAMRKIAERHAQNA